MGIENRKDTLFYRVSFLYLFLSQKGNKKAEKAL
jgi:hypothetical protein